MFRAVKGIERAGRGHSPLFSIHILILLGAKSLVTEAILVHCGVAVPQFTS